MNRILLSLLIVLIALTSIACVSASSDFNGTADCYVNETVVEDDIEEDNSSELIENDTEVIDDSSEWIENDTDNEDISEISIDNSTKENDLEPVTVAADNESKLIPTSSISWPKLNITPPEISTGDRIYDEGYYYSFYYRGFKEHYYEWVASYSFYHEDEAIRDTVKGLIGFIYQSHNEKDTIDIVTKAICIGDDGLLSFIESDIHRIVEGMFYSMYTDHIDEDSKTPVRPIPRPSSPDDGELQ